MATFIHCFCRHRRIVAEKAFSPQTNTVPRVLPSAPSCISIVLQQNKHETVVFISLDKRRILSGKESNPLAENMSAPFLILLTTHSHSDPVKLDFHAFQFGRTFRTFSPFQFLPEQNIPPENLSLDSFTGHGVMPFQKTHTIYCQRGVVNERTKQTSSYVFEEWK